MTANKVNRYWVPAFILLVVIIVAGSLVAWSKYNPGHPVEISMPQGQELMGRVYIGGAVANPGYYPFTDRDSIESLLQAAGGTTGSANLSELRLRVSGLGEGQEAQKIDINRAEVRLLKSLPGIGEALAQRIVDYRYQNGPFLNVRQIVNVTGIGTATYERIEHLITVAD